MRGIAGGGPGPVVPPQGSVYRMVIKPLQGKSAAVTPLAVACAVTPTAAQGNPVEGPERIGQAGKQLVYPVETGIRPQAAGNMFQGTKISPGTGVFAALFLIIDKAGKKSAGPESFFECGRAVKGGIGFFFAGRKRNGLDAPGDERIGLYGRAVDGERIILLIERVGEGSVYPVVGDSGKLPEPDKRKIKTDHRNLDMSRNAHVERQPEITAEIVKLLTVGSAEGLNGRGKGDHLIGFQIHFQQNIQAVQDNSGAPEERLEIAGGNNLNFIDRLIIPRGLIL